MIVLVAVLFLVLAATGVFLATRLLGNAADGGEAPVVEGIRERPEEVWTYSYQGRDELAEITSLVAVGEQQFAALIGSSGESAPSRIVLVDGARGEERWSVPLESIGIDDIVTVPELLPVSEEGHLTVSAMEFSLDDSGYVDLDSSRVHLVSLDPADGSVVSETTVDGYSTVPARSVRGGNWLVSEPTQPFAVVGSPGAMRLDTAALDGEPIWSAGLAGTDDPAHVGRYLRLDVDGEEWWLDGETGFEPEWLVDPGPDIRFLPLSEEVILRYEYVERGHYYLDALDASGEVRWSAEPDQFHTVDSPEGPVLFFSESGASDGGSYAYLMRIDPRTGEEMWDEEYEESSSGPIYQTVGGLIAVPEGDRTVLIDLRTGAAEHHLRGFPILFGTDIVYTEDGERFRAWDAASGDELWSLRPRSGGMPVGIGSMIVVVDGDRGQITRLR